MDPDVRGRDVQGRIISHHYDHAHDLIVARPLVT
jgi:hypothetical protein